MEIGTLQALDALVQFRRQPRRRRILAAKLLLYRLMKPSPPLLDPMELSPSLLASQTGTPCSLTVSAAFLREEQQLLDQFFQRFATLAARQFAAHMNTDVSGRIAAVEAIAAEDLSEVNPFQFFGLQNGEPPALVQFDLMLARLLIEASLGGRPAGQAEVQPLTVLERRVLAPYFDLAGGELTTLWPNRDAAVQARTETKISRAFANYSLHGARVEVTLFDIAASLRVVIPTRLLRVVCQVSDMAGGSAPQTGGIHRKALRTALAPSEMELAVEVEMFRIALADIANLQPDDVLAGDIPLDAPLTVKLNGIAKYEAGALQLDGERAVRLRRAVTRRAS